MVILQLPFIANSCGVAGTIGEATTMEVVRLLLPPLQLVEQAHQPVQACILFFFLNTILRGVRTIWAVWIQRAVLELIPDPII